MDGSATHSKVTNVFRFNKEKAKTDAKQPGYLPVLLHAVVACTATSWLCMCVCPPLVENEDIDHIVVFLLSRSDRDKHVRWTENIRQLGSVR